MSRSALDEFSCHQGLKKIYNRQLMIALSLSWVPDRTFVYLYGMGNKIA